MVVLASVVLCTPKKDDKHAKQPQKSIDAKAPTTTALCGPYEDDKHGGKHPRRSDTKATNSIARDADYLNKLPMSLISLMLK